MSKFTRYLLDTNVVSESRRSNADTGVSWFFRAVDERHLHISALTIGELCKGAEKLRRKDPERALDFLTWINEIELSFGDRVLPIEQSISRIWGEISADRGRPVVDTLIAATAIANDLVIVTRNVRDFRGINVEIMNPWDETTYR